MKSKALQEICEFVQVNKRLVIAFAIAVGGLLALQSYVGAANRECLGIADSREMNISFETPVVVKRIFVLPGEKVKKGQPLVEVEPVEINLKLIEVQTQLEALRSEQKVRDSLLKSFSKRKADRNNPIAMEVAGLQRQVDELTRQQANAVRYAEEDGVVATVMFKAREQVAPFLPVITMTSTVPNLVYGFVHESRVSEFQVGDDVTIEPVSATQRATVGKVLSLGNRITPFPERFQTGAQQRPTFFGRELVISLDFKNEMLVGEKVRIRAPSSTRFPDLGFQAFAASGSPDADSVLLAEGMEMEAGGIVYLPAQQTLLMAADENGANGSPFFLVSLKDPSRQINLRMSGLDEIDDVESVTTSNGQLYAMSSLSKNKKDKVKVERSLLIRFSIQGDAAVVDRVFDFRSLLLESLKHQPLLRTVQNELDTLEVEAFTMANSDGYMALKHPQLSDGSSIVLKIRGLGEQIQANAMTALEVDVYAMVKLNSKHCSETARISDIQKTKSGLLMLSNCKKSEKTGQIWWLADQAPQQQANLLTSLRSGRPEGMALDVETNTLFITSDNGKKKGSDLLRVEIPAVQ